MSILCRVLVVVLREAPHASGAWRAAAAAVKGSEMQVRLPAILLWESAVCVVKPVRAGLCM